MKKTKAFITMAILMLSVGAYGCSPSANRDHLNPITGNMYNNTNSFSGNNGYYSNNTINNRNNHINPITGRINNNTNSFSRNIGPGHYIDNARDYRNDHNNPITGRIYNDSNSFLSNNGYGYYSNNTINNRNSRTNSITGRTYNDTNPFSRNNGPGYFSNNTISRNSNNTINRRTRTNNGVNNIGGNRVLSNRRHNLTIDGDHTFTNDIITRHSLDSNRVSSIRKGMTYNEVLSLTGIAPYFKNQSDVALANNRQNGIAYYFVNGRSLKISFINGIVDRVYY